MGASLLLMLPKIITAASAVAGLGQTQANANRQEQAMRRQKKDAENLARKSDVPSVAKPDIDLGVEKAAPIASLRKTGPALGGLSAARLGGL